MLWRPSWFIRVQLPCGSQVRTIVQGRPRGLSKGKTAYVFFTSACEFIPTLREMGSKGIAIQLYVMDKMLFSAFTRPMRARHAAFYSIAEPESDDEDCLEDLQIWEWDLFMSCKSHGCSNAVVKSIKHYTEQLFNLKDPHIVIESLRNTSQSLIDKVDDCITTFVKIVDSCHQHCDVLAFWSFMLVKASLLVLFCDADPVWDGESLSIPRTFTHRREWVTLLRIIILHCLSLDDWSETRWCKMKKADADISDRW